VAIVQVIGSPHGRWEGLENLPNHKKLDIVKDVPSTLRQRLGVQGESALPLVLDTALTECGYDLLERMLRWDPRERLSAAEALKHDWFQELPREVQACFMPQTNDALRRKYA
jgi:cell division cycle 2-like